MNRHPALLFSLAALGGLPALASALPLGGAVPPDSFINQNVSSVGDMRQQVTLDPVVRRRLARHFHTSGPAVVRYIQDNLVLKKLGTTARYQVYCIARDGREYVINSRLVAGTPVFVMRTTGKPVLKLACGNPMMASLPPVVKKAPYEQGAPQLAALPPAASTKIAPTLAPGAPLIVASGNVPGALIMPAAVKVAALPIALHTGGGFPLGYLAGIPILAGIIGHGGGNGNSGTTGPGTTSGTTGPGTTSGTTSGGTTSGTTSGGTTSGTTSGGTTSGTTSGTTGVTPVPEPSGAAAFVVGAVGLAGLLAGSRRRTRRGKA